MNEEAKIKEIEELIQLRKSKNNIEHDTCIVGTKELSTLLEMYKVEKQGNKQWEIVFNEDEEKIRKLNNKLCTLELQLEAEREKNKKLEKQIEEQ